MKVLKRYWMLSFVLMVAVVGCSGDDYGAYFLISQDTHNFGVVAVGNNSVLELKLTNAGQASLKIEKLEIADLATGTVADEFEITEVLDFEDVAIAEPYEGLKVKSKKHITIKIKFEPTNDVAKSANLAITHNVKDIAMPYLVELLGNTAQLQIAPTTHNYGIVDEGNFLDETFTITNNGTTDLMVYGIDFAGDTDFALENSDTNFELAPSATKNITVRFTPLAAGGRTATMTIRSNSIQSPTDVVLNGVGKPAQNFDPTIQNPIASPDFAKADGTVTVTFTVEVDDPNGIADIEKVEIDFSSVGGTKELMFDDGTNGDATADDKTFTVQYLIPSTASAGLFALDIVATDYSSEEASASCALSLYKGNLIYVDDATGDDTTGTGSQQQPYKTIQKGIDVATDSDIVIIMDGEYKGAGNVDLDLSSGTATAKKIVVKSENGNDKVTIDCENAARGFIFNTAETTDSIIQGLTIKNGFNASQGGGILISSASPSIVDCVITENNVTRSSSGDIGGAGVFITGAGAAPEFYYTEISKNVAYGTYGSASGYIYGGGVYVGPDTEPYFEGCKIIQNEAIRDYYYVYGAGMYFGSNTNTRKLVNCVINENVGTTNYNYSVYGGGIYTNLNCHLEFIGCEISENENSSYSTAYAGGIYANSSNATNVTELKFDSCKLNGNFCQSYGSTTYSGAIYGGSYVEIDIDDCEINYNTVNSRSSARASAFYLNSYAVLEIDNSEISYNTTDSSSSTTYGIIYHSSNCKLTFDKVKMNYNIVRSGSSSNAYGLIYNSSNNSEYAFTNSEFNYNSIYGYNVYGGAIRISSSANKVAVDDCEFNYNYIDGTQYVYGGVLYIASTNPDVDFKSTAINENTIKSHQSTIYGGVCYFLSSTDASFESGCEINDNLVSAGSSTTLYGVGLYAEGSCDIVFDDSEANGNIGIGYNVNGGSIYIRNNSTFNASGSKFNHNKVTSYNEVYGCGAYFSDYITGTIEFCEFNYNEAFSYNSYVYGAGVAVRYTYNSTPYLNFEQSDISYNFADGYYVNGGGFHNYYSQTYLRSCLISNNRAESRSSCYGGGLYNYGYTSNYRFYLYNCTVTENDVYQASPTTSSSAYGGGIYNINGYTNFYNSIIWGNSAHYNSSGSASGNEFYASYTIYLYYTNVATGSTNGVTNRGGGYSHSNLLDSDPLFVDMEADDYTLSTGSPCIDSGDNTNVASTMTKDFANKTRVVGSAVDRGCYEKQ